jgi:hypothetical protein
MAKMSTQPTVPTKTYYLELDGKPSCCSPRHAKGRPPWSCGHSSHEEARHAALLVWRDHPDCVIAIKEGPCPRYLEEDDAMREYYSRYDDESY